MFSVIIPAYNAEKFLHIAIKSVLEQTYQDFEIIVVDDGSADNTGSIVSMFPDTRIRYIFQENSGVSSARNTGIVNAEGSYVCFLDADDEWLPNHLEVLHCLVRAYPVCNVFFTGYKIRLLTGEIISHTDKLLKAVDHPMFCTDNGYELLWKYGYIMHTNSICCRKTVFEEVGYFAQGVKNGEDDDMWYRLLAYYSVAVSKEMTTIYNRENSRATAKTNIVQDWVFLDRVNTIMASRLVTEERKASLRKLLERKKLTRIRKEILNGSKKNAIRKLIQLDVSIIFGKKYIQTWLALLIPSVILRKAKEIREKGYYLQDR